MASKIRRAGKAYKAFALLSLILLFTSVVYAAQYDKTLVETILLTVGTSPDVEKVQNVTVTESTSPTTERVQNVSVTQATSDTERVQNVTVTELTSPDSERLQTMTLTTNATCDNCNAAPTNEGVTITNLDNTNYLYSMKRWYLFEAKINDSDASGNSLYSELDFVMIAFSDGVNWVNASFNMPENQWTLISGSSVADIQGGSNSTSGNQLTATFNIRLDWDINDALNIELYQWANDTSGESTGWTTAQTDYANIETDITVSGFTVSDTAPKVGSSVTWSGTVYYEGSTVPPPDAQIINATIHKDSDHATSICVDSTVASGAFSCSGAVPDTQGTYQYHPLVNLAGDGGAQDQTSTTVTVTAVGLDFSLQAQGLSDTTLSNVKFDVTLPNSTALTGLSADSTGYYNIGFIDKGQVTVTGYWRDVKGNVSFTYTVTTDETLNLKLQVGRDSSGNFRFIVGSGRLKLEEINPTYQVEPAWIQVNSTVYTTGNHTGWSYDSATHILTVTDSSFKQSTTLHTISWNLDQVLLTFNATGSETLFKASWAGVVQQGGGDKGGGRESVGFVQPFSISISPTQLVAWVGETTTVSVKVDWTQVTEITVTEVEISGLHRDWVAVVTPLPHDTVFGFDGSKVEIALSVTVPPDVEPQTISLTLTVTAQSKQGASATQQQPIEIELRSRGVIQTQNVGDYALYGVFVLMVALIGGGAFMRGRKTRVKTNPKLSRRDIG